MEVWVEVCYWGLQTLTLFQTKTIHFAALFKTILHHKHSPHVQGFWSRKTPCSLPRQPFFVLSSNTHPQQWILSNLCTPILVANSVNQYSTKGCSNYTRSQLDTLYVRHKTKKLWILFTVGNGDQDIGRYSGRYSSRQSVDSDSRPHTLFSCKCLFRPNSRGVFRVLSESKEWSSSCLEIMLGFLSLLLYYSILFFFLWYNGTEILYVTLQLVKVRMISWSFVQQTFQ